MCLTVSNKHIKKWPEFPNPFTCDKDILVFKSLNVATYTLEYKGVCNSTINLSTYPSHYYVTPAFAKLVKFENGRATLETEKFGKEFDYSTALAKINEGIHTCQRPGITTRYGGQIVFFCIIPAGTEFYIGTIGDVVSKKILIFENAKEFLKYREERGKNNIIDFKEFDE